MHLFQSKTLRIVLLLFALFLFGCFLVFNYIASTGFTILEHSYQKSVFKEHEFAKLLKGEKIVAEIPVRTDYLGIVSIRFNTFGKINKDTIIFRIKEKGQGGWIAEHGYLVNQFQPDGLFTFGFPIIERSKNKTYVLELESKNGSPKDAVAVSQTEPVLVTKHQFPKSALASDKPTLIAFFLFKALSLLANPVFILFSLLSFSPFFLAIILVVAFRSRRLRFLYKKRFSNFSEKIDDFFLLDKNRSFPELDGLRAWAVTMVFMAHVGPWLGSIISDDPMKTSRLLSHALQVFFLNIPFIGINGGGTGVDIFFVISGFLIFMTIVKNTPSFWRFIWRRFERLMPTHVMLILGLLSTLTLVGIFLNIFFLVDFFPLFTNVNLVTWTLSYEIVFYFLCALWLIQARRSRFLRTWKFLLLVSVCLFASQWILTEPLLKMHIKYLDMHRFIAFFFGVALAKLYFLEPNLWKKLEGVFLKAAIPGLLIITIFRYSWEDVVLAKRHGVFWMSIDYLLLDFGIFLLVGSLLVNKGHILKQLFGSKALRILGVISYSFYLFHYNFGLPIAKNIINGLYFTPVKMIVFVFVAFVISFLVSVFLFHFLEKPYFVRKTVPR